MLLFVKDYSNRLCHLLLLLALTAMLSACATAQEPAWSGGNMVSGDVRVMGPSAPLGP